MFWLFTVWIFFWIFENSRPSASNFKSFSWSVEQFFLTVGQNNFGNKIPSPESRIICKNVLIIQTREAAAAGSPLQRMTNWRLILLNECSCWDNSLTCYLTLAIFHDKTRVDICLPVCSTDVCILGALHTIHFEEILAPM